jgi:DNA-directed RNA polymerase subunit RPC12/RpoP
MARPADFDQFEASELFCPRCRQARPVRKTLLLVLPSGSKYDYRCATCGTPVGTKQDDDRGAFAVLPDHLR